MPVIGQGPYQGVLLIAGSGVEDGIHQQSLFVSMKLPEGEMFNEEAGCSARTFILKIKNKLTIEQDRLLAVKL
jgi:hypothetical protein